MFLRFFAVLWLRGWGQAEPKSHKRYKPQKTFAIYTVYTVFCGFGIAGLGEAVTQKMVYTVFYVFFHGFLRFCGSEAGIRTQADPKPQKNRKKPYKP